jgi:GNAT superfamily N-acetyltransferase
MQILRPALKADIPGMHRVRRGVRENGLSSPDRVTEADYEAALDQRGRTWVMDTDGSITAFATGYRSGNIWALFVQPEHEGRGYGKQLHTVMVGWLWSQGLERLWLTTVQGTRAERFYRAQGWQPCGLACDGDVQMELYRP